MTSLIWIGVISLMIPHGLSKTLSKRRLDSFAQMINDKVDGLDASDINGYGGWCGIGGSGEPKDEIDRCCMHHDHCYHNLRKSACKAMTVAKVYLEHYTWGYDDGEIVCLDEEENNPCKPKLCGCDRDAVNCFAKNAHSFTEEHKLNDTFTTILDYIIKAYMHKEWIPDNSWPGFEELWKHMETKKWEFIQKHIPEQYWEKLTEILPAKYIPDEIKEKLAKEKIETDVVDTVDAVEPGSGKETPGTDSAKEDTSYWTKLKDMFKKVIHWKPFGGKAKN